MSLSPRRAGLLPALALLLAATAAPAADVARFDDLLRLVRSQPDPAAVLEQCGDTVFTLNAAQRAQLAKAGAAATLVDALQKKRMGLDDVQNFALIVDCSGSMKETLPDGRSKMDAAKAVLTELVAKIPDGLNISLTLYGHDAAAQCKAVEVKRPLGPIDSAGRAALTEIIAGLEPVGHTPIAAALRAAAGTLAGARGLSQVVLVTDGMETCHEDPAAVAEAVTLRHQLRRVEVVGLGLKPEEKGAVTRIARRGRDKFYDAQTAQELAPALTKVVGVALKPRASAESTFTFVDLQAKGNHRLTDDLGDEFLGNNLGKVPKGEQSFAGSRFKIGAKMIQPRGEQGTRDQPRKVEGIEINAAFDRLHILHSTEYGESAEMKMPDHTEIGAYVVHYEDRTEERIPIVYGADLRDWWDWPGRTEVSRAKVAWAAMNSASERYDRQVRLFAVVWTNPHPEKRVMTIDVESNATSCRPFLVALSLEKK